MSWPVHRIGHGVGLRRTHFAELLDGGVSDVEWFEIISENFFEPGGRPWAVLDAVRAQVPIVCHGTSMAIGNFDPVPEEYLRRLKVLIERVEPVWVSDHLCWGGFGGKYAHDLLPLPYTEEALRHVVGQIERVQEILGRQIMVENVSSYVKFSSSSMPEWEFLSEVAERADCGILLDVNNIYVSASNHGFDALDYLHGIPVDRVGQFHLAGHTDKGNFLLDTHVGPVPDPVWSLYREAVKRFGAVAALIEWDEDVPPFETVVQECRKAKSFEREVLT